MNFLRKGFFVILLFACFNLHAQRHSEDFSSLKEESWFPKQSVSCVYQDSKGRLWIGTNAGLYQYNLSNLLNYNLSQKSKGRLLNNSVYTIAEDSGGNILIGTESGIGALDIKSGEITLISSTDETINKIVNGNSGNIWCVNNEGKIYRLNFREGKYKYDFFIDLSQYFKSKVQLNDFFQLNDGRCLLATNKGLYQMDIINKAIYPVNFKDHVVSIFAAQGYVFLGTANHGLFSGHLKRSGNQIQYLPESNFNYDPDPGKNYVYNIKALNENQLVISTPLAVYISELKNIQNNEKIGSGLSYQKEGVVNSIMIDRSHNIWVGSQKGLFKYKQHTLTYNYHEIIADEFNRENEVSDLVFDQSHERLLVATSTDGIHALNLSDHSISRLDFPEKNIKKIELTSDGNLLIVTFSNVYLGQIEEDGTVRAKVIYTDSISDINQLLEVYPGEYWATSWNRGMLRINTRPYPSKDYIFEKIRRAFGSVSHLFCIEKDNQNNVWIGSRGNGIVKISLSKGDVTHYKKDAFPGASNRVIAIDTDSKGRVWVSTRGDGLLLYEQQKERFRVFDTSKGLPSNTICAFAESSNGEIWVSTLNGLAKFDEDNLIPFHSYGTEDGIYSTEFNFNVSSTANDGVVFFGTGSGVYGINNASEQKTSEFPLLFTQFTVLGNNKKKSSRNGIPDKNLLNVSDQNGLITLKHNENNIRIAFSTLDYTIPVKNKYAYRLNGYDTEWKFAEGANYVAQYYDLPAGDYRFEVKRANARGHWAKDSSFLDFKINQSFWVSNLAMLLYLLALLLIALIIFYLWEKWFRLNSELLREKDETYKHKQQMVLYTDLSHEIKNRLSLILGPLEQALHGKKVNQDVLNNLYGQALRLKKLSDQILNIRKSEYGKFILAINERNIEHILAEIYSGMEPLAVIKGLDFKFVSGFKTVYGWIDEELIEIIMLNLLSNAIKYTNPNGSVRMKAELHYLGKSDIKNNYSKDGNYLFCSVTDTGIGIPQTDIDKVLDPFYRAANTLNKKNDLSGTGIGLDLVSRLVNLHKGWLELESEQNESTVINVYIPVDKIHYKPDEIKPDIKEMPIVIPARLKEINDEIIKPPIDVSDYPPNKKMKKILVAEDDEEIRDLIVSTLNPYYVVYSAANGSAALSLSEKVVPDLVLSDLVMPLVDGLTLCGAIREKFKKKHIPFIILTGRNSEEQKLICFQHQVDDFMEKPFSPELLMWRVKSMLQAFDKINKEPDVKSPGFVIPESADDKFIQDVIAIIDENLDKEYLNVEFLAGKMCMSRATFYRKMESLMSESPSTYIRKYRLKKAAVLLSSKKYTISEVAYHTGFNDPNYFAKCFQKEYNTSPSAYIKDVTQDFTGNNNAVRLRKLS